MTAYKPTPAQLEAAKLLTGPAGNVLLRGGARSGKTFKIVEYMVAVSLMFPNTRQLIARNSALSVRQSVGEDTFKKVMRLSFPDVEYLHNKSDGVFRFANGSEIWLAGLDNDDRVDKILGKEFCTIFINECSEVKWDTIKTIKTRLAQKIIGLRNKFIFDCNPTTRAHWSYRLFIEKVNPDSTKMPLRNSDNYVTMKINPIDNAENLPEEFLSETLGDLTGKAKSRFVDGEYSNDNEFALWKMSTMIEPFRVAEVPSDLDRIVIGVDPALTANEGSDETGIIVAGAKRIGKDVHYYVLADRTIKAPVKTWASRVITAAREFHANFIVAETNAGGDTVVFAIRNMMDAATANRIPVIKEHAKHGKLVRAEPVSLLYAKGLVHHVGDFPDLEAQMYDYTGVIGEESPDRLDALVYAILYLSKPASKIAVGYYNG